MEPRKEAPMQDSRKQQPPTQRRPVRIYTISDKVVNVHKDDFKSLVQRLTGKPSSPASQFAATEDYIEQPTPPGILSPEPFSLPSPITPDFFSPDPTSLSSPGSTFPPISPDFFSSLPDNLTQWTSSTETTFLPSSSVSLDTLTQDGYWNQERHYHPSNPHSGLPKRARPDYGHDMESYLSQEDISHSVKDTRTIGSAYDLYLESVQTPSMSCEEVGPYNGVGIGRPGGNNMGFRPSIGMGFGEQDLVVDRPSRELVRLPPDASNTLFIEGLPSDCSEREVAHIFRPFLGYREVRLVIKDTKQRNGDPIVLCFVDFDNPACAATAHTVLQGYQMDEYEPDPKILHIQFSRNPGLRPGQHGGRR